MPLGHGDQRQPERLDQRDQLRRTPVHELGAELHGRGDLGVVRGVDAAAEPVARLHDHDAPAPGDEPVRRRESGHARPHDQHVGVGHRRYS